MVPSNDDNPYESPSQVAAANGLHERSSVVRKPPFKRYWLALWIAGIVFPSAFFWTAGLIKVLKAGLELGSPTVDIPSWLALAVLYSSLPLIMGAGYASGHKFTRQIVIVVVGSVMMGMCLWATAILLSAVFNHLGI